MQLPSNFALDCEDWIKRTDGDIVVVFVHGILSDCSACWTNDNGSFWPTLLAADPVLPTVGVYVFDYRADVRNQHFSVADAVTRLYSKLEQDGALEKKALIFVTHSLGGLVVRKLITSRQIDLRLKKLGLFFVASPARGSDYLLFFRKLVNDAGNPQLRALSPPRRTIAGLRT